MRYSKYEKTFFIRFEPGEEILTGLKSFCDNENVKLATVQAIGAINKVIIGFYDLSKKEYFPRTITGDHEITSLNGTITEMNDSAYIHLHITIADEENKVIGGHLNEAIVSATCEMVVTEISGKVNRYYNKDIGINLLDI